MSVRFLSKYALLILLLSAGSLNPASADTSARRCLDQIFKSIGAKAEKKGYEGLAKFSEEVQRDGFKRFVIKDIPKVEVMPDRKLFGLLQKTETSDAHWFWRAQKNIVQFPSRMITKQKKVLGAAYDFIPLQRSYELIEKAVLPKGKTLNTLYKVAGGGVFAYYTYPYTVAGLVNSGIDSFGRWKKAGELDDLINDDYRFNSIKQMRDESKDRDRVEKARKQAIDLAARYEIYFDLMKKFHSQGLNYDNPAMTMALMSDRDATEKLAPLFRDVYTVLNPDYYKTQPNLDISHLKSKNAALVHELYKLNHLKLMTQASVDDLLSDLPKVDRRFASLFESNEFYQRVKGDLRSGKINRTQARAMLEEQAEWNSRLKMYKVVGVIVLKTNDQGAVTQDTVHIEDIEKDILFEVESRNQKQKN